MGLIQLRLTQQGMPNTLSYGQAGMLNDFIPDYCLH